MACKLIVAKAYLDQLERSQALPAERITELRTAIQTAEDSHMNKSKVAKLRKMAPSLEKTPPPQNPRPMRNGCKIWRKS